MWVNELKIALATGDLTSAASLILDLPKHLTREQQQEAAYLIQDAISQLESKKRSTLQEMAQIKRSLEFIRSTAGASSQKIDLTS